MPLRVGYGLRFGDYRYGGGVDAGIQGSHAGMIAIQTLATGVMQPQGVHAGVIPLASSAEGVMGGVVGEHSGTIAILSSAQGVMHPQGTLTSTIAILSSITGTMPFVGTHSGTIVIGHSATGTFTAAGGSTPVVEATSSGSTGAISLTHPITMPAGVAVGEELVVIFASDDNPTISVSSGTGWTEKVEDLNGTTTPTLAVYTKTADGSDALTLATSSQQHTSFQVYRISGGSGNIEVASVDNGGAAGANADPPNLAPSWGAKNTLWIAAMVTDGTTIASAAPTNYTNLLTQQHGTGTGASISSARRGVNAAAENPGAFTSASEEWGAVTIAIEPT